MTVSRRHFLASVPVAAAAAAMGASLLPSSQAKSASGHTSGDRGVLIILANEITHPKLGFPLGFWAAELTHPYAELLAHGKNITIASLQGGQVKVDAYSDPRHESGYSAHDFISLGFLTSPKFAPLLDTTSALSDIDPKNYDALIVAGGQAPMFTFRENSVLQNMIRTFFESGKPTAALCHGTAALVDVQLSDGRYLVDGRNVTGFSAAEDAFVDQALGAKLFDWWVEPALRERGARYSDNGMWANYAVADGNLITGQQQNSGVAVARLVLDQLS